jgi:hypothetical protein
VTKGQVLCVVEDNTFNCRKITLAKQKLDTLNQFERQKELNRDKASEAAHEKTFQT